MQEDPSDSVRRADFGEPFYWGVSSSAFQTEGACDADGKGLSIWDVFTAKRGRIRKNQHARTACDFYRVYRDDIALIRQLGIPNFRFSLSWPRILPEGTGAVNAKGIDFYNRLIDSCLENGIEPWVTLYHWDLPYHLEKRGGWTNRDMLRWFETYAECCVKHFGDRVTHWMVLNEPAVFTAAGYFFGMHAPGRIGLKNFLPAAHHAVLSMGHIGRLLRSHLPGAQIGTTFSCSHIEPASPRFSDVAAARRADALINRLFAEPVLGMGYPINDVPALAGIERYMRPGDEQDMAFDFDFIGLQNYTREIVKHSFFVPYLRAQLVKATRRRVPVTAMGWEVYPRAIYHVLHKFAAYANIPPLVITENGAAFADVITNGEVNDEQRRQYLQDHLAEVRQAKKEGVPVRGYFVWTLTDNFEWAEGYHPRFGLVHVDFETQQRTIKASGKWYTEFLR